METNRAANLDTSALWRVVIYKWAYAQDAFIYGDAAAATDIPATKPAPSPSDAAHRPGITENKICDC